MSTPVSASDSPRFLQANLADWDAVLLRVEEPFFVSAFRPLADLSSARLEISGYQAPTFERRGDSPGRIHSGAGGAAAWYAPDSRWAVGLGGRRQAWSQSHADGAAWSFRAREDLGTLPLSLGYRGLAGPGHPAFSALAILLDGEKGSWMAALSARGETGSNGSAGSNASAGADGSAEAGGSASPAGTDPRWEAELRLRRESRREAWSLEALDTDSAEHRWQADYGATTWGLGLHAAWGFGFGTFAAKGGYAFSRPDPGRTEHQLGDSSQMLRAGLSLRPRRIFAAGRWTLRSEYAESQAFTQGMRRSPGRTESIRFHHALGRASSLYSGAEWTSAGMSGPWRLRAGAFHRYYRYRTSPHPDAHYERKETFSYNRLESSLLASLYGGFLRSAELVRADLRLHSAEFRPVLAADFGPFGQFSPSVPSRSVVSRGRGIRFGADLSLPAAVLHIDARVSGETVTRQLLSTEVERRYAWSAEGPLVTAAPGLAMRLRTGPAGLRVRASHALILWSDVRTGDGGKETATGSGDVYPWMGNGALLEAAATLDF